MNDETDTNTVVSQESASSLWHMGKRMLVTLLNCVFLPIFIMMAFLILLSTFLILTNGVFGQGPMAQAEAEVEQASGASVLVPGLTTGKSKESSGTEDAPADPAPAVQGDRKDESEKTDTPKQSVPAKIPGAPKITPEICKQLGTPRRTFEFLKRCAFQNDFLLGSFIFDPDDIAHLTDQERKDLVYDFDIILSRLAIIHVDDFPDDTQRKEYFFQPNNNYPPFVLVKRDGYYQFAKGTSRTITELYPQLRELPPVLPSGDFLANLPEFWFKTRLGLSYIQWIGLLFFLFTGYLVGWGSSRLLHLLTLAPFQIFRQDPTAFKISRRTWQPIGWLTTYAVWYVGILVVKAPPIAAEIMGCPIRLLAVVMCILTAIRLTDIVAVGIGIRVRQKYTKIDQILVPLFSRSMKILIVCWGIIMLFQLMGFSAVSIVSGMGIGGIAIALAAQNTIANFFGSLTVLMDRPFVIGDWIVTSGIEGEVESVGMRSTRVRTFYNSQITIPNNLLTTAIIDNMGRRHFRRYKTFVKVHYNTPPERLEAFCEGIRELILSYSNTRKDVFHVYVNEMGDSSIDILLTCFFLVPDFASEAKARSILILDIMRLAQKMHVEFAYPTQTIYNIATTDSSLEPEPLEFSEEQARTIADDIIETERASVKTH